MYWNWVTQFSDIRVTSLPSLRLSSPQFLLSRDLSKTAYSIHFLLAHTSLQGVPLILIRLRLWNCLLLHNVCVIHLIYLHSIDIANRTYNLCLKSFCSKPTKHIFLRISFEPSKPQWRQFPQASSRICDYLQWLPRSHISLDPCIDPFAHGHLQYSRLHQNALGMHA